MKKIIIPNEKELQKQLDEYWENAAKEREQTHTKKMYKKYLEGAKID